MEQEGDLVPSLSIEGFNPNYSDANIITNPREQTRAYLYTIGMKLP